MASPGNPPGQSKMTQSDDKIIIDLTGDDDPIQYVERKTSSRRKTNDSPNHLTSATQPISQEPDSANTPHTPAEEQSFMSSDLDALALTPRISDRFSVRNELASITAAKRDRFFVDQKDYFLPLLPDDNHIKRLLDEEAKLSPEVKAQLPNSIPYEDLEVQPTGIKAVMKPYQLSGLSFLVYLHRNGLSGILGDEMGLGKTLQTLSLMQFLKENEPTTSSQVRPFLVICPLSVLNSWIQEARKWTPGLQVLRYHGPAKERDRLKKVAAGEIDLQGNMTSKSKAKIRIHQTAQGKPLISLDSDSEESDETYRVDLIVTTYESYQADYKWFKRAFVWRYVILDEGHRIKNQDSKIAKLLQGLHAEYRLILTGTPLQNDLGELWALLYWLYPEVFTPNTRELFTKSFNLSKGQYAKIVVDHARHLLELVMLRRMKDSPEVLVQRLITHTDPNILEEVFRGAKDQEQASLGKVDETENLTNKDAEDLAAFNSADAGAANWDESKEILEQTLKREQAADTEGTLSKSAWQQLMNLLMQLRKVSNHPYQISGAMPNPYALGDHVIRASGKFIVLEKLVNQLVVVQQKKVLIFSSFTHMLDLVEDLLSIRGGDGSTFRYLRLDGSTVRARRNLAIRLFNDVTSNYRVMLISTKAGGLGINLTSASDVVMLDQEWNPQLTLQAEARAHRIGQTQPVTVYKLVSQGTVEEQMVGRLYKKLFLSAKVTETMQDIHSEAGQARNRRGSGAQQEAEEDEIPQLGTSQLLTLVRRGASAISSPAIDVNEVLGWDWDTTVAKCKDQPIDVTVTSDANTEEDEKKWLSTMERVKSSVFDGRKLERAQGRGTLKDISEEWNRSDRRVGKETTVMINGFAVKKEFLACKDGEAVPTLAGKDPRLAEPERVTKARFISQRHCQVCLNGGEIICCRMCPRAYHIDCLDPHYRSKAQGRMFVCPQHHCADCDQNTNEAGGMLYRCRWCERAHCDDCLDFDKTLILGGSLQELKLLNYGEVTHAYYIQCPKCTEHFANHPEDKASCDRMSKNIETEFKILSQNNEVERKKQQVESSLTSSRAPSLSDSVTIDYSEVSTPPQIGEEQSAKASLSNKRKSDGSVNKIRLIYKRTKAAPEGV